MSRVVVLVMVLSGAVAQARDLLKRENTIRDGLLNAYLAPFRYISSVGEVRHIRDIFQSSFRMSESDAAKVQSLYESVARPLLYDPVHPQDPKASQDNFALVREPAEAASGNSFWMSPLASCKRTFRVCKSSSNSRGCACSSSLFSNFSTTCIAPA